MPLDAVLARVIIKFIACSVYMLALGNQFLKINFIGCNTLILIYQCLECLLVAKCGGNQYMHCQINWYQS